MNHDIQGHLLACGAVRFGEFTLTSGATSNYYVDVKAAMTHPGTLRAIAAECAARILATEPSTDRDGGPYDAVAGMELGAVPLATAVSLATDLPLRIIRKGTRAHGTGKQIEGGSVEGMHILVVEDVTTSGGSTVEAVKILRDAGATVTRAISVVDRESGGPEALAAVEVILEPLATASQLLATPQAKEALQ